MAARQHWPFQGVPVFDVCKVSKIFATRLSLPLAQPSAVEQIRDFRVTWLELHQE